MLPAFVNFLIDKYVEVFVQIQRGENDAVRESALTLTATGVHTNYRNNRRI